MYFICKYLSYLSIDLYTVKPSLVTTSIQMTLILISFCSVFDIHFDHLLFRTLFQSQALDVQWIKCRVNVEKKIVSLLYNKEKASNAFFGTNVNKSVYLFVYGFRLTFAVFMDGDLPNSFSAASFIREQTIILH